MRLSKASDVLKDFSFISDIINEKLRECGVWWFSFKGNKRDIVNHDGETVSVGETLAQTNSHIDMLMDTLLAETPDIYSDYKNILIIYPTDVFHVKKNGVYFSVLLPNRDAKFIGISSGVAVDRLPTSRSITPSSSQRPTRRPLDGTFYTLLR